MDGFLPLRPILSALETPAYKIARFLVPVLSSVNINECTVKKWFHFVGEILEQDSSLFKGSLSVDSLFPNIPLEETVDIFVNSLFQNDDTFEGFNESELRQSLYLATKESHFLFSENFYKQVDGVAMGSSFGPTFANSFLAFHDKQWLKDYPIEFTPLYYGPLCYVDEIFVIFKSPHILYFWNYLNSEHPNMFFSLERKSNNIMPL